MRITSIKHIDVVRLLSALLVVVFHLNTCVWLVPDSAAAVGVRSITVINASADMTWFGWVGVEIFFVISGLIIRHTFGGRTAKGFLVARVVRLYPAVWLCGTATLLVLAWSGEEVATLIWRYLRTMTLFPVGPWIDGVYWTLGVEVAFYAIAYTCLKHTRRKFDSVIRLVGVMSAFYWISSLVLPMAPLGRVGQLLLIFNGCQFALGVEIYRHTVLGVRGVLHQAMMILFALASLVEIDSVATYQLQATKVIGHTWPPMIVFICAVLFMLFPPSAIKWKWLGRHVRTLGLMTYPLYLFHETVGGVAIGMLIKLWGMPVLLAEAIAIGMCLAISWIVAMVAEPYVQRRLKRWLERDDVRNPALSGELPNRATQT
jgi:peptidoglycan/LPS O-acetylase OafA/YrhL